MTPKSPLRNIPSIDRIAADIGEIGVPRTVVVAVARRVINAFRDEQRFNANANADVVARIRAELEDLRRSKIQPIINATGVILHTNFGRAPLDPSVARSISEIACSYNNLEYDLQTGSRGTRASYVEHNLAILCGAEAATIVNNCAGALLLVLNHFTQSEQRKRVIISRGELVQIGGGFRVPDILRASGATLHEIGTTNQTTCDDYRIAIDSQTALILKVHQSNFFMDGFVADVPVAQLAPIARSAGLPLLVDIGSGAIFDTTSLGGNEREPTPRETLAAGADLVTFSGDKLLGGPQAGIIAGSASLVAALKKSPLMRALRCDKLVLTAMQACVDLLLANRDEAIPIRAMMQMPLEQLRRRAERIVSHLAAHRVPVKIVDSQARIGGGSLPRTTIRSLAIELCTSGGDAPNRLAAVLRRQSPPVVTHVANGSVMLDLRTVFESQDEPLTLAIVAAIAAMNEEQK